MDKEAVGFVFILINYFQESIELQWIECVEGMVMVCVLLEREHRRGLIKRSRKHNQVVEKFHFFTIINVIIQYL